MDDKKLLIVFGAGASYDCADFSDSTIVSVEKIFRPPLVNEIFDNRGGFNAILKKYTKAEALSDEIRTRLKAEKISLEDLLNEYESEPFDFRLKKQYWEIPL